MCEEEIEIPRHGDDGNIILRVPEWLNPPFWSRTVQGIMHQLHHQDDAHVITQDMRGAAHHPTHTRKRIESSSSSAIETHAVATSPSSPFPNIMRPLVDKRLRIFHQALSRRLINLRELQSLAIHGIPNEPGLRSTVWKVLLRYVPLNKELWERELTKKRLRYYLLKQELLIEPSEVIRRNEEANIQEKEQEYLNGETGLLRRQNVAHTDHPLSDNENSIWSQFFQDREMAEQIKCDIKRTHPNIDFFSGDSTSSLLNQEAMQRILFIFAKLNPAVNYVQGMNEILAPLYYVFKEAANDQNVEEIEADVFFCFAELFSNFLSHFCQRLDNTAVGIRSTMGKMLDILKEHDPELWWHLDSITKVNPQFYAFRWITLLLTQEFSLHECLRIWDSLFSNPEGPMELLLRICCAMMIWKRNELLGGDFASNVKLLQRYPSVDLNNLLNVAKKLK